MQNNPPKKVMYNPIFKKRKKMQCVKKKATRQNTNRLI